MTRRLEDFVDEAAIDRLHRPSAEALGLPGAAYADPGFYELERRSLFPKVWVAAAMAGEIPDAGDVLPVGVAGHPLVFTRDAHGEIRGFHNICRHRGAAVAMQPSKGNASLRCPWHGWNYGLDGALRGTPEFGGIGQHEHAALDRDCTGLVPVRTARWLDFVFVNLDGEAPPLDAYLAPLQRRFAAFDLARFEYESAWRHRYPGNWKIAVEGAIEDYHLSFVHPQITDGARRGDMSHIESAGRCFYAVSTEWARYAEGRAAAGGTPLPGLPAVEGRDSVSNFFVSIFPTGIMGFARDYLYAGIWMPHGHDRTELSFHFFYYVGDAARAPEHRAGRDHVRATIEAVFRQDDEIVRTVHERAAVRDALGIHTRFSPFWETAVHRFQKDVVETIRS